VFLPKPEKAADEDNGEDDESVNRIVKKNDNPVANKRRRMSGLLN